MTYLSPWTRAAAGGFTDVLLRAGASYVYAIGGLWQLIGAAPDPRVSVMERTNARALTRDMFDPLPALTVMDVSLFHQIDHPAPEVMGRKVAFLP